MAVAQVVLLLAGSVLAVVPWRRLPGWIGPGALAVVAIGLRVVPVAAARTATHDLAAAILFLLLAVPLAVLLDRSGFFTVLASRTGGGRHLRSRLWVLAALVTIVFNLDAAVVLLTPLYVRIADQHDEDPVVLGLIPALLAALASSVLPVSNLTNLIAADRLGLGAAEFITHLGLPSLVAIVVGGVVHEQMASKQRMGTVAPAIAPPPREAPMSVADERAALRIGTVVVVWLLLGFIVGERFGVPAWVIVAVAVLGLAVSQRILPWRHIPIRAAVLAAGLGVLATAAAPHLGVDRLLSIAGAPGELATIGIVAVGANAINNLPTVLVTLHALDGHRGRVWAVLIGADIGSTLWITGSLSSLLWQATMRRLGHTVTAVRFVRTAAPVGIAALAAASAAHLLLVVAMRT